MNECRLCLKRSTNKTPSGINFSGFYHIESGENEFFEIIRDIFGVKITLSPLMVFTVCIDCKGRISGFHSFFKKVQQNLENLHVLLTSKVVLKKEDDEEKETPQEIKVVLKENHSVKEEVMDSDGDEGDNQTVEVEQLEEGELVVVEEEEEDDDDGMMIEALEEAEALPEISEMIDIKLIAPDEYTEEMGGIESILADPYRTIDKDLYALLETVENRLEYLRRHCQLLTSYDRRRIFYGFKCYRCDKRYAEECDLQQHLLNSHNVDKVIYKCCNVEFTPLNQMDHITFHLNPEVFKCPVCSRKFDAYSKLRRHFRGNCGKENALCSNCGDSIPSTAMYTHMKKHQKDEEDKQPKLRLSRPRPPSMANQYKQPYVCEICDRRFPKYCKIKYHIEMQHLGLYKETCEICGREFINKYSLEGHMKLHTERQPEECPICGRFVKRLQRHISLNHETNAVICPECGRTFPNNLHYIRHKHKAHNKQIYKCEFCDKVFKEKTIFVEHRQAHMGGHLYSCEHCLYKANYKRNLLQHFKKAHHELWLETKRNRLLNEWGPTMAPKYARIEEVQQEYVV